MKKIEPIGIPIGKKMHTITYQDFIEVRLLADLDNVTDIHWKQLSGIVYDDDQLLTLNVFLYYIINIAYNVQIPNLQGLYLKKIAPCYFQSHCEIQIAKFSKFCAKLLDLPKEYCFHLCYYLIYGKLASNSYIKAMMGGYSKASSDQQIIHKNINKLIKNAKTSKEGSMKKLKKITCVKQQPLVPSGNEYEKFAFELHSIFKERQETEQNKHDKSQLCNQSKIQKNTLWEGSASQRKYYLSYFPKRVQNTEKSAIMQTLHPSYRELNKKVRKIKFNPDQHQYKKKLYEKYANLTEKSDGNKQNTPKSENKRKMKYKTTALKVGLSEMDKINHSFKLKSEELDGIRRKLKQTQKGTTNKSSFTLSQNKTMHPKLYESDIEKCYMKMKKKASKASESQRQGERQNKLDRKESQRDEGIQYSEQNQFEEISKKLNPKNHRVGSASSEQKDDRDWDQNEILKLSCKKRLYYYRTEYRNFMKTHIFNAFAR